MMFDEDFRSLFQPQDCSEAPELTLTACDTVHTLNQVARPYPRRGERRPVQCEEAVCVG